MRSKFKWIFTFLVAFTMQFSFAQEKTITGVVSDANGSIAGVNVSVQGGTRKTQSDFDGKYSIKANVGDVLVFSFVGMQELRRTVGTANTISVKMATGEKLTEVVIQNNFGYFKKDANKVLAAVSVVSGAEIQKQVPSMSALNALQGKAAGVTVTARNGQPGAGAFVNIRGAVAITTTQGTAGTATGSYAGASYIVDGAFMREDEFAAISSSDIETFNILKDGASAAIYGARGANGVVVVTTKRGSNTKAKFEVNSSFGFTDILKDPVRLMTGNEKLAYEKAIKDGPGFTSSASQLDLLKSFQHDWRKDLLRQGTIQDVNFSVRGGSDKVSNYFSFGMLRNNGNIVNLDGYKRFTANYSTDYKATDKLTIGLSIRGAYEKNNNPRDRFNAQNPFFGAYNYNGYEPLFDRDANGNILVDANGNPIYNNTQQGFPVAEAILNNLNEQRSFKGYARPYIRYNITKSLVLDSNISLNYERGQTENFTLPGSVLDQFVGNPNSRGSKNDNGFDRLETQFTNQLNYKFTLWKNHNFEARALYDFFHSNFRNYNLTRTGFVGNYATAGTLPTAATTARTEQKLYAFFGGLDYDYAGKYLISVTGRQDYNSLLGPTNRSKFAKGGSIGWVLSKESWMKLKFIDFLKLRASYGELNTENGVPRYANIANFGTSNYGGAIATTYLGQNAGSPEIGFEQAKKTDFGFEARLFNSKLAVTASYFNDKRNGFIFSNVTGGTGLGTLENTGDYTIKGYDLELKAFAIKNKNTSLSFYVNAAQFDRKINALQRDKDVLRSNGLNIQRVGYSPDAFFLVQYAGVDKTNGDALYYDLNGVASNVYSTNNRVVSDKTPYAKYEGGFGMEFEYKGFDLSSDFVFRQGNYIYNLRYSDLVSDGNNNTSNQAYDAFDFWTAANPNASLPAPFTLNSNNVDRVSDRYLEDGSFIRFRTLNIGYSFTKSTFKNLPLDKVRLYTQIQNLYTWSKFKGDPEIGIGNLEGNDVISGAFQGYSYPNVKTVMFGLTVNF